MNTENLQTLKIHKLTQAQYDRELAAGNIDENALYLTPDEEMDLSGYATIEQLNGKANTSHTHEIDDINNLQTSLDALLETSKSYTDEVVSDIENHTHEISDVTSLQTTLDEKVSKAGDTMTGELTAVAFKTGDRAKGYIQTRKLRGVGNIDSYHHAIDLGYTGKDSLDFHEYGGVFNFYKNTAGTADGGVLIGQITKDGFIGNATSATTASSATKATQDADGNVITSTYETKADANIKLDEAKTYADGKADKTHTHSIDDVTNLQSSIDTTLSDAKAYTDTKTSDMATSSSVNTQIGNHNTSTSAHNDIRVLISDLTTKLNNFLDVDSDTTDQLSEVLTLIENNKGTLESLTTSKVNVSDIIDNLITSNTSKALSANQGVVIKGLIDALQSELDSHTNNTTVHTNATERTNWNVAYTHSQSAHAPSNAEKNQNAFSNVKIGNTTLAADTTTDTLTLVAGTNITITPDTTNDIITISSTDTNTTYSAGTGISLSGTTFSNSGVRSIETGTTNGTISVDTNGTMASVAVKGLGTAAYTSSDAYDAIGSANDALETAKTYTDEVASGKADFTHNHDASNIASGTLSSDRLPTVPVAKGGTGLTTLTSGSYLVGNGTEDVSLKTPTEVMTDLGAMSATNPVGTGSFSLNRKNPTSVGSKSVAMGEQATASGDYSHAEGFFATASGEASHAEGNQTNASGNCSHAEGFFTEATGDFSHAEGYGTIANAYQHASGKYNVEKDAPANADVQDTTFADAIFLVGYGTSETRANAFRISSGGRCFGVKSFGASGADFAELFEWTDGNINNEDRRGLFVTLDGEKIRLANSDDDYIGVISGAQAFIGNTASEEWQGKYLTDIFGDRLSKEIEIPEKIDEETGEVITPAHTTTQYVVNPDYNPDEKYIMRENRKEWGTVGLLGQVVVIDDGTCVVGGYCKPLHSGIGTASDSGYRVMKRIDENHIKVLVK